MFREVRKRRISMSPIKIVIVAAGLVAITAPSAMADGFRYTGSPKFGQFREQSGSVRSEIGQPGKLFLDSRAQLVEPQRDTPKGGIGARGL
jgi:hypothetical protein